MSAVHFDRDLDSDFVNYMQRQLGTNWCWAACATSIYNYVADVLGSSSTAVQEDMVALQKGEVPYEVGNAGYLLGSTLNFNTKVYDSSDWDSFYSFVFNYVNSGSPILVNWAQDGVNNHYVIVYAFEPTQNSLYIFDPQQYETLYMSSEDFSTGVTDAWAIGAPSDKTLLVNPLYGELIPDSGIQNFCVENNSNTEKVTLNGTITSNGKSYKVGTDFAYYIRITKEEDYTSAPYIATGVKIKRSSHSYEQWLYYGNLLTVAKQNLKIINTNYQEIYGYQLDNFWVQFIPVTYLKAFTPST